jgi:Fe-S oxidoreductase
MKKYWKKLKNIALLACPRLETICTSCPFCMTMLDDGVKDKGKEEEFKVKDIAEIVAQYL